MRDGVALKVLITGTAKFEVVTVIADEVAVLVLLSVATA
jgi:hypothetical protein